MYFADCDVAVSSINAGDDIYIAELLNAAGSTATDLLLETNGGNTDATEKICSQLRHGARDVRVIVPRRAKSNGTVIALAGSSIAMGMESELRPIDPSISNIPVQFILNAPAGSFTPVDIQLAETFRKQTEKLAKSLLSSGMLKDAEQGRIDELVQKTATRDTYHSHGSVIDADEAKALGLAVQLNAGNDDLWKQFCLLRAMYQFDCDQQNLMKVFEGNRVSLVVPAPSPAPVAAA